MSDFVVKIVVKNGRLLRAIRAKFGTSSAMSRETGISKSQIAGFLTMRLSPVLKTGDWSKAAFDVSSALAVEPEELWPSHIARIKLARNEREIDMTVEDVAQIVNGTEYSRATSALKRWAKGLNNRQITAIVMHSNGATLDEIGAEIGAQSRERARQIVLSGMRKVRMAAHRDGVSSAAELRTE